MKETSKELSIAIKAALRGGAIVLGYFEKQQLGLLEVSDKSDHDDSRGLVTQADIEAESTIIATIKESFPNHEFLGEESNDADLQAKDLWIIDPLDGTNNFAHGICHFAVSVAYYQNGIPQCGVVLDPISNTLFYAEKGCGAYQKTGASITELNVNAHSKVNQTLVAVGFYYDRGQIMRDTLAAMERLFEKHVHGIRRMGAATLDLINVAKGGFGAYFEYQLSPWDFAAARLIVEEANGKVTNTTGNPLPLSESCILASNGLLHEPVLELIKRHPDNSRLL